MHIFSCIALSPQGFKHRLIVGVDMVADLEHAVGHFRGVAMQELSHQNISLTGTIHLQVFQ
jgi:hypothetical protein